VRARLVVVLAGLALAGCGAPPVMTELPAVTQPAAPPVAAPVSVSIPKLHITDEVVTVGLAADGEMEVPEVDETGWYEHSPMPGEIGPSLLVGHVNYDGVPGALGRIGELTVGDQITVTDSTGTTRTFAVYDVAEIPKAQYRERTVPLVFGHRTTADLELVTCSGPVTNHEYANNTIASARLVT
jgi:sortase (surface protein transpeptidase)